MITMNEFLLARTAEDEVVARKAIIPAFSGAYKPHPELSHWRYAPDGEVEYDYNDPYCYPVVLRVTQDNEGLTSSVNEEVGPHIARFDPARVLAECAAKRRIVNWAVVTREHEARAIEMGWPHEATTIAAVAYEDVITELVQVYADHPDFRGEWHS